MKTAIELLQEKNSASSLTQDLQEEVCNLKGALATIQESYLGSTSQRQTVSSQDGHSWSDVVRRKPGKTKGKGLGGKGVGEKGVRSRHERGSEQSEAQGPSKQSTPTKSTDANKGKMHSQHQFVPVPGKRKVWGTRRVCSSDAVKSTIVKQIGPQSSLSVKKKFTLGHGNRIVKWWHVVAGDEEVMTLLEKEWGKIKAETSWSIKPCLSYANHPPETHGNPSSQLDNQLAVGNNASSFADMHVDANKSSSRSDSANEHCSGQSPVTTTNQSHSSSVRSLPSQESTQTSFLDQ